MSLSKTNIIKNIKEIHYIYKNIANDNILFADKLCTAQGAAKWWEVKTGGLKEIL